MTVKLTYEKILFLSNLLANTAYRIKDFKISYALKKNRDRLDREAKIINELIEQLRDDHQKIVDGKRQFEQFEDGSKVIIFNSRAEYAKELQSLLSTQTEIDLYQITFNTIADAEKAFPDERRAILLELIDTVVTIKEEIEL